VPQVGSKAKSGKTGYLGTVIVALQQTQLDDVCALRIFAKLDVVFERLARELKLNVAPAIDAAKSAHEDAQEMEGGQVQGEEEIFSIPYDDQGKPCKALRILDLREGAEFLVTAGPYKGSRGVVGDKNREGHYRMRVQVLIKEPSFYAQVPVLLGKWWPRNAAQASGSTAGDYFPIASVLEANN